MQLLLAIAGLLAFPVNGWEADSPKEEIEAYLSACELFGWSGVCLIEERGKEIVHAGYGLADRETERGNAKDTLFEIASITKPITATALLILIDAGKLELDDSIADYLPGVPEKARGITVRHLLSHTAGMPRSGPSGHGDELAAAVGQYLSQGPTAAPGSKYEYWNGGYALAAGIIEQVSGKSYMDFLRKEIFGPAKMKRSGFTGDSFPDGTQAIGYEQEQAPRLASEHPYGSYGWHYKGMGGIVMTAADLASFVERLLDGKLLKNKTLEEMVRPQKGPYGLGWSSWWSHDHQTRSLSHGGDVRGFHSQVQALQNGKRVIVLLSNVGGIPTFQLADNLAAILDGKELRYPFLHPPSLWKGKDLEALAGTWHSSKGEELTIEVEGVGLLVTGKGEAGSWLRQAASPEELVQRRFIPTGKSELHGHDWSGKDVPPKITIAGKPRSAKSLHLEGVGARAVLLERAD